MSDIADLDRIIRRLDEELPRSLDLDRPAPGGGTLADALFDAFNDALVARALARQQGPDGEPWPDLSRSYAASPAKRGLPMTILTGEMMSPEQLHGERTIAPAEAVMAYGRSDFARRKMLWFDSGTERDGRAYQPERPLYGLDAQAEEAMRDICERQLAAAIRKINR